MNDRLAVWRHIPSPAKFQFLRPVAGVNDRLAVWRHPKLKGTVIWPRVAKVNDRLAVWRHLPNRFLVARLFCVAKVNDRLAVWRLLSANSGHSSSAGCKSERPLSGLETLNHKLMTPLREVAKVNDRLAVWRRCKKIHQNCLVR